MNQMPPIQSLHWENCRIVMCLFARQPHNFSFYIQSAIIASCYISNELHSRCMNKRWKLRMYIEEELYLSPDYLEELKLLSKCDVELYPCAIPSKNSDKYWFTSLRFILPSTDVHLDAFRLLDCHYLWSREDIKNLVDAVQNWEASDKRCCVWKYINNATAPRPYCAATFSMNISTNSRGEKINIDYDDLIRQLQKEFPRIKSDFANVKYSDDEWLMAT